MAAPLRVAAIGAGGGAAAHFAAAALTDAFELVGVLDVDAARPHRRGLRSDARCRRARVRAEDGREVVRVVRAAYDSMQLGRAVAL